jgi:putative Mg2+ transporter-C (MgtC) family protein
VTIAAVSNLELLARVGVGFGLSYVLGFERQLRGSVAGDRTFSVVGTGATAVTAVAAVNAPQAVAGVLSGIGFIGAGVVFKGRTGSVHGVTTAATLFAVAGMGIVAGYGYLIPAVVLGAVLLVLLELPNVPFLKQIDARTYAARFLRDPDLIAPDYSSGADYSSRAAEPVPPVPPVPPALPLPPVGPPSPQSPPPPSPPAPS